MIRKVISELKKYVAGRKNTEKTEVSVLNLNRLIFALEEQESVLDKIRAEIKQLRIHKAQYLTSDNKVCIDSQEVLDIIDKYKAESEVSDGDSY